MLISLTLLSELLASPDLDPLAVDAALTSLGLEVEARRQVGEGLETVVVARIEAVTAHTDADALRCVRVFDGAQTREVVCGAPNVPEPGGRVVFARPGSRLPGGLEIGTRTIRGVESAGMICAEDELDIGTDHSGIIVLPADAAVGQTLASYVPGVLDTVFELSVTPNRPDALGHVGVARDLAVKLGCDLRIRDATPARVPDDPTLVRLDAPARCGRYLARAFEDARVGPSPLWLRVRLHRLGLRAINNVVDVTNLVLMEWGQPLHVFNRDRLAGGGVVVRTAAAGESLVTLEDRSVELQPDDLVIADAAVPQALAGIMGGRDSGVEVGATRLLLEAAWFHPAPIRKSARTHQLATDSSHRFERGVDFEFGLRKAAARAAELLEQIASARGVAEHAVSGAVPELPVIGLRPRRVERVLGFTIPPENARTILSGLEVEVDAAAADAWSCRPPSHRPDLQLEEDLIEEIVRHHGLDALPAVFTAPSVPPPPTAEDRTRMDEVAREAAVVDALRAAHCHEHVGLVFTSAEALAPFAEQTPQAAAVAVTNPMRTQQAFMRTHLLPGLLEAYALNRARHARPVRLFELGRVYRWPSAPIAVRGPTAAIDAQLPCEPTCVAVIVGPTAGSAEDPDAPAIEATAISLGVLARLGMTVSARPAPTPATWLHPKAQAVLVAGDGTVLGRVGRIHPDVLARFDLADDSGPSYAELWIELLATPAPAQYRELPRFPATSRDLSLEIPIALPAALVIDALRRAEAEVDPGPEHPSDPPRLSLGDRAARDVEILEDYRGDGVRSGYRALLFRLHYRAAHRSVTDLEVQRRHAAVVAAACEALHAYDSAIAPR